MSGHRSLGRVVGTVCLVGLFTITAPARAGVASDFSLSFSPATPGTTTTLHLHFFYRSAADPHGKPPALAALRIETPVGTRFATDSLPKCTANDLQLRLVGRSACPLSSKIGYGTLIAVTGFGAPIDPVLTDVVAFNNGHEIVETVSFHNNGLVVGIDRVGVAGNVLTPHPPATPGGPPNFKTTVRELDVIFPAGSGLVTTPPVCPADGQWPYSATIDLADGTRQVVAGAVAC